MSQTVYQKRRRSFSIHLSVRRLKSCKKKKSKSCKPRKKRWSGSLRRNSTKFSALKTEPPTMKKEIGASGRTGSSPVAQPSRVSHRRRKSWAKPGFTPLPNRSLLCRMCKGFSRKLSATMQEVTEYRTISFSCDADQAQRGTICCGFCRLSCWGKAAQ